MSFCDFSILEEWVLAFLKFIHVLHANIVEMVVSRVVSGSNTPQGLHHHTRQ
jgi:hypothetical protein